jgi:hypothetical protein
MKQRLFALYDKVAEQFGPIFQAVNVNTAIRTVQNMKIRAYDDFELYELGEWDMESGRLKTYKEASEYPKIEWITPIFENEMKAEQKKLPFAGVPT